MTGPGTGHTVNTKALHQYAQDLGAYKTEADEFGKLIDQADVTDESWGLIGLAVKQTYTDKLTELRDLLDRMREGVDAFTDKIDRAAEIYDGHEKDATIKLGKYQAEIDGPR